MNGKKNLVMGMWSRLPFEGLERFIASLRRTGFDGDVCVFIDDVSAATVRALMAQGVIVERAVRFALLQMNMQGSRYFNYLEFLSRYGEQYSQVMITDLRDVLFQSDPLAAPLPADLVFAQERVRVRDCPVNRSWLVQTYGEAMADNLGHCMVSCSGTTFGTVRGMQQYLTTMINELASRPIAILGGLDQAVHNYMIRMRPLRNAWCDPTDSIVATMAYTPDSAISVDDGGVRIDGRLVPVIHQWDRKPAIEAYVEASPNFRLPAAARPQFPIVRRQGGSVPPPAPLPAAADALICYYHAIRDRDWMEPFLASLRAVGFAGGVHCVGAFGDAEHAILARHGAVAHPVTGETGDFDVENIAHIHMSRVVDMLAADAGSRPDQVMLIDTMRAGFLRDPFLSKTIGLSGFMEGPGLMGASDYNTYRLGLFVGVDDAWRQRPVVSSALLRGGVDHVREFYRRLFTEIAGRIDILRMHKVVQGAFNKLLQDGSMGIPVVLHPNGAEVFFEIGTQALTVDQRVGVRVGGTIPAIVISPFSVTPLIQMLRSSLHLQAVMS